jgi:hypothetical protein
VALNGSSWTDITLSADSPMATNASYDKMQIIQLAVQITSGTPSSDAAAFGAPQSVTVLFDNIHD